MDLLQAAGTGLAAVGSASWSCLLLNGIPRGTSIESREGLSVYMHSLLIRGNLSFRGMMQGTTLPQIDALTGPIGEILVVYDREPDTTATSVPPLNLILEQGTNFQSALNLDYRDRFDVLLRKKVSVPLAGGGMAGFLPGRFPMIDMKVPIGRVVTFKTNVTTPTAPSDIRKGSLYAYFLGDWANTSADALVFRGFLKLAFTETN
jgi:hypothetical protein